MDTLVEFESHSEDPGLCRTVREVAARTLVYRAPEATRP